MHRLKRCPIPAIEIAAKIATKRDLTSQKGGNIVTNIACKLVDNRLLAKVL